MPKIICEFCGETSMKQDHRARFCNVNCRNNYGNKKKKLSKTNKENKE